MFKEWKTVLQVAFFTPFIFYLGNTHVYSQPIQTDLCNVRGFIESLSTPTLEPLSGPIKGCVKGDAIHFQIDGTKVPYAPIVARYCDLTETVVVENFNQYVHVVCGYKWKWAKEVTRTKHPDAR